jgi:hypothetical protein
MQAIDKVTRAGEHTVEEKKVVIDQRPYEVPMAFSCDLIGGEDVHLAPTKLAVRLAET